MTTTTNPDLDGILSGAIPSEFAPLTSDLPERELRVLVRGLAPGLICHNGRLADSNDELTARVNRLVEKLKAGGSEEVARQLKEARMLGGLYLDEDQRPIIPVHMLTAAIAKGCSRVDMKKSKLMNSAISVMAPARIIHDGPEDLSDLVKDERFQLNIGVKIGTNTVIGTRPIFRRWAAQLSIAYETDVISRDRVIDVLKATGRFVGLGDWRPTAPKNPGKYGRFVVQAVADTEV